MAYLAPDLIGGVAYLAPDEPPASAVSTVTSVVVTPDPVTILSGGTQQFAAQVIGTNSPSQVGTWSTGLGSISSSGLLTGPIAADSLQTGVVTFTSAQDPTKSGSATFYVYPVGTELVLSYRFIPLKRDYNTDTIHLQGSIG